jgi:FlaG/FlaF family flagellin (archaellin)
VSSGRVVVVEAVIGVLVDERVSEVDGDVGAGSTDVATTTGVLGVETVSPVSTEHAATSPAKQHTRRTRLTSHKTSRTASEFTPISTIPGGTAHPFHPPKIGTGRSSVAFSY